MTGITKTFLKEFKYFPRWALTAAHCLDDFKNDNDKYEVSKDWFCVCDTKFIWIAFQRRTLTIRDKTSNKENVEFKKYYVYPYRENLYDDIAVIELGRRIPENYDEVYAFM